MRAASVSSMQIFNFIIFNCFRLLRVGGLVPIEICVTATVDFYPVFEYGNEANSFLLDVDIVDVVFATFPCVDIIRFAAAQLAVFQRKTVGGAVAELYSQLDWVSIVDERLRNYDFAVDSLYRSSIVYCCRGGAGDGCIDSRSNGCGSDVAVGYGDSASGGDVADGDCDIAQIDGAS